MGRPGMAGKVASTSKYLEAVFLSNRSDPIAKRNAEKTNCRRHLRSQDEEGSETSIYDYPSVAALIPLRLGIFVWVCESESESEREEK